MKIFEKRPCASMGRREAFALNSALAPVSAPAIRRPWLQKLSALAAIAASCLLSSPLARSALPATTGWYAIPQTQLRSVCPANNFGGTTYSFTSFCPAVVSAWNSGVMDTTRNRLIVWGGGHNDYAGNELYAVNFNDLTIQRLTNPSIPTNAGGACSVTTLPDGRPNSRHTYDGLAYIAHADKMFVFGGSLTCTGGYMSNDTWAFDFATAAWQKKNPSGTIPRALPGIVTAYDPATGLVFLHDDSNFYSYDLAADRYTRLSSTGSSVDYHLSAVIDPVRKKFVMIGGGQAWVFDIGAGSAYIRQPLATTGGSAIVNSLYPGLAYDPVSDRIVAWHGGDTVYSLNLTTNTWTPTTFAGGPGAAQQNGTYKRWSYSPASGAFVLVNAMTQNAYALRLAAPTTDTTPDAFAFTPQTGVAPGIAVTSNAITVSGIDAPAPVSISGGSYSIGGAAFVTTPGTVTSGASLRVQLTSSASSETETCAGLSIGGVTGSFCATTQAIASGDDTTPDAFSFAAQTGVAPGATITSASITVAGINAPAPISIAGGTFSINGGAYGSIATTVTAGNTVTVRLVAAATNGTQSCATLTIGGVAGQFCATTQTAPPPPPSGSGPSFTLQAATTQTLAPFTIGLGFRKGDVSTPVLDIPDHQVVVMRRWNDGSVKHAIASGEVSLTAGTARKINVSNGTAPTGTSLNAASIAAANPQASIAFGSLGTVNLSSLLATPFRTFVSGPQMVEAHYRGAVGGDPTLVAWFHVRLFKGGRMWVRAIAENSYLDVTTPNKSYVPTVTIGGTQVWNNGGASLTHYAHTRWTRDAWIGGDPQIAPQLDTAYLKSARLVPNYNAATADAATLNGLYQTYAPYQRGNWTQSMGDTGYQDQIGLLPLWDALYVVSGGDQRAYKSVVANATALNSYPIGWTDSVTKLPVKPSDRPNWGFDGAGGGGSTSRSAGSLTWEIAHHGSGGYLAYLITGDYFHLETMLGQAATAYLAAGSTDWTANPAAPNLGTSRYFNGQTRGYAWAMRTLSQYAAIAPAGDAIAADYGTLLAKNIDRLKALKDTVVPAGTGYVYEYDASLYGTGLVAPWQQHFFMQALGMGSDLEPLASMAAYNDLRDYMYRGAVGILGDSSGYCFTQASVYNLKSNAGTGTAPNTWYKTWAQVYAATFATPPACGNTLAGSSGSDPALAARGYWGNLIPAIAYAVEHGATGASAAWARLTGATNWNTVLQSGFERTPTWGIVPRAQPPVVTDTVPDPFAFAARSDAPTSTVVTSDPITVAGINAAATIGITGGTYNINGGAFTATAGDVSAGNTVSVRLTTASSNLTQTCATLTIGGVSGQFCATTQAAPPPPADTTPDPFSFAEQTGVALSATVTSETIAIGGIDAPAPVSIAGGTYSVNAGGYTALSGTLGIGSTVSVRFTSAATGGTRTCATLTIGGVPGEFCATTLVPPPAPDTTPDPFAFAALTGVPLNSTQTSNAITVTGINVPAQVRITNGTYSVNGGAFIKSNSTVSAGNTVRVRLSASHKRSTQVCATLTIGERAGTFCVTTAADGRKSVTVERLGSGSGIVVADVGSLECAATCNGEYPEGTTITLTAIPDGNSRFTGWLGACTGTLCRFTVGSATSVVAGFAATSLPDEVLDIDGNGVVEAESDGLLIMRYLLDRPRSAAMTKLVGNGSIRTDEIELADYLDDIRPVLDIDGDGATHASTDGTLILRYLDGLRGQDLIADVVGANATRTSAAEIEAWLRSLMPAESGQ